MKEDVIVVSTTRGEGGESSIKKSECSGLTEGTLCLGAAAGGSYL